MRHTEITGRKRLRTLSQGWGKPSLLVLQVEERGIETSSFCGMPESEFVTRWRDATVMDLEVDLRIATVNVVPA